MSLSDHWNGRYESQNTPWDSGLVSRELRRVVEEAGIEPCRVLEPGCGTGTNAVWLASQGFEVTAVDCSQTALDQAKAKADELGVPVEWICANVAELPTPVPPFQFIFDRGCFHCVRRDDPAGSLEMLERLAAPGTKYLLLTGNSNEARDHGPPSLSEAEIRNELGPLFEIQSLREFHFEDPGGVDGPLGWSCLMTRR